MEHFLFSVAKMNACNICFGVSSDCELGVPQCCTREKVDFRICQNCFVKVSLCIAAGRLGVCLLCLPRF